MLLNKKNLMLAVGRTVETTMPWISSEIDAHKNRSHAAKLKKCVINWRTHNAKAKGDDKKLEDALATFWKADTGDQFHEKFVAERFALFLRLHAYSIDDLAKTIAASDKPFSRFVEIGCGDGHALKYCNEKLPDLQAVGLDLNKSTIRRAQRDPEREQDNISFIKANAISWLSQNPEPGTAVMTNAGVLEYCARSSVIQLFDTLARSLPSAVVLIEPLSPDHDLETEHGSIVFGAENSFSHNYPALLEGSGFDIIKQDVFTDGDTRWIVVHAAVS